MKQRRQLWREPSKSPEGRIRILRAFLVIPVVILVQIERANRETEGQIRALRGSAEEKLEVQFSFADNALVGLVRDSNWLFTRSLVRSDGKTPYQRIKGKLYSGDVCEIFEWVLWRVPNHKQDMLEDRWLRRR